MTGGRILDTGGWILDTRCGGSADIPPARLVIPVRSGTGGQAGSRRGWGWIVGLWVGEEGPETVAEGVFGGEATPGNALVYLFGRKAVSICLKWVNCGELLIDPIDLLTIHT